MKIYKITCYSDCGTYFSDYLQSLTIVADNTEEALGYAKKWIMENQGFILPLEKCSIQESDLETGIVDYVIDSDY